MHKIDGPGATPQNTFTDGDVITATAATTVGEDWLNAVQAEVVNAIEAVGITLDKGDNTQLAQAIALSGGGGGGGLKNYLINGDFQLWQRGETFSTIGVTETFTSDRWIVTGDKSGGTGTIEVARVALSPEGVLRIGSAGTPESQNALSAITLWGTLLDEADNGGPSLEQRVEGLLELSDEDVSFSAYFESEAGVRTGKMELIQDFGSGGSASVVAKSEPVSFSLPFRRVEISQHLPSVSGKTIGAGAHLKVRYENDPGQVGAGKRIWVTLAQLERGLSATKFDYRSPQIEELLVARYWEKSYPKGVAPGTAGSFAGEESVWSEAGNQPLGLGSRFRVRKRAVPVMTWYSPNVSAPNNIRWLLVDIAVISAGSAVSEDSSGFPTVSIAQPQGGVLGQWVADAEL